MFAGLACLERQTGHSAWLAVDIESVGTEWQALAAERIVAVGIVVDIAQRLVDSHYSLAFAPCLGLVALWFALVLAYNSLM